MVLIAFTFVKEKDQDIEDLKGENHNILTIRAFPGGFHWHFCLNLTGREMLGRKRMEFRFQESTR